MELSSIRVVRKPWGKTDLRPWSELGHDGAAIGEIWFHRTDPEAPDTALLLKLLFTDEPLSIQVHPDDEFATSIGLPSGKTEAWYVLAAGAGAQVALGIKRELTRAQLRGAIVDGSIPELVQWVDVAAGDSVFVPAGTIHAIGAGLVIAEIQQRSDATFRLFDHGRQRDLHVDGAVGSATAGPAAPQARSVQLSEARNVVAQCPYFVLEHIDLAPDSNWEIDAASETWLLILEGDAVLDRTSVAVGEAMFIEGHRTVLRTGDKGAKGLLAYVADAPLPNILQSRNGIPLEVMAERYPELRLDRVARVSERQRPWGMRS